MLGTKNALQLAQYRITYCIHEPCTPPTPLAPRTISIDTALTHLALVPQPIIFTQHQSTRTPCVSFSPLAPHHSNQHTTNTLTHLALLFHPLLHTTAINAPQIHTPFASLSPLALQPELMPQQTCRPPRRPPQRHHSHLHGCHPVCACVYICVLAFVKYYSKTHGTRATWPSHAKRTLGQMRATLFDPAPLKHMHSYLAYIHSALIGV